MMNHRTTEIVNEHVARVQQALVQGQGGLTEMVLLCEAIQLLSEELRQVQLELQRATEVPDPREELAKLEGVLAAARRHGFAP